MSNVLVTIKHDAKQMANDLVFSTAVLYGVYQLQLDNKLARMVGLNPFSSTFNTALLSGAMFAGTSALQREAIKMKLPVNVL